MKIVFSLKRSSYKDTETAAGLKNAISTGIGVTTKVFSADEVDAGAVDNYIRGMARNDYVCHVADYSHTYKLESSLIVSKVA